MAYKSFIYTLIIESDRSFGEMKNGKWWREEKEENRKERERVGRGYLLVKLKYSLSIALLIPPHILRDA